MSVTDADVTIAPEGGTTLIYYTDEHHRRWRPGGNDKLVVIERLKVDRKVNNFQLLGTDRGGPNGVVVVVRDSQNSGDPGVPLVDAAGPITLKFKNFYYDRNSVFRLRADEHGRRPRIEIK